MSFEAQYLSADSFVIDPGVSVWGWFNVGGPTEAASIMPLPVSGGQLQYGPFLIQRDANGCTYNMLLTNTSNEPVEVQFSLFQFGIFPGNL
jgi:hypothetical protein